MAQGTAQTAPDYKDQSVARSVVMAALGEPDESEVEASAAGDTDATEAAADDVDDSDESAENAEETAEEGTESDDEEPEEEVEAKSDGDEAETPFSKADKAAIAKDPTLKKAYKGLMQSYTKRMQELGETEKFQKMLQGDPQAILQRLAEANGLKVKFGGEAEAPVATSANPLQMVAAGVRAKWLPIIGEEATDQLLAGVQELVSAGSGAAVKPIIESQTKREQEQVQARFKEDFGRFEKEHPDWREHENAMLELSKQVNPQMSPYDTAKFLYTHVTRDRQIAAAKMEGVTKAATRVKRAVADAEPVPRTRIPGSKVKTAPPVYATAKDAVRAAMAEQGYVES